MDSVTKSLWLCHDQNLDHDCCRTTAGTTTTGLTITHWWPGTVLFPLLQPTLPSNHPLVAGHGGFDRNLHSRMPLSFTPLLRLKRCHACDQWHSSRVSTTSYRCHCKFRLNTEGNQSSRTQMKTGSMPSTHCVRCSSPSSSQHPLATMDRCRVRLAYGALPSLAANTP
jgi:hypothetical protein